MANADNNYVKTHLNPGGFIEQVWVGAQSPDEVIKALKSLERKAKKEQVQERPVLLLLDVSRVRQADFGPAALKARLAGIKLMGSLDYKRAAVYGPLSIQILVNTMAMVAGVHQKIRVFDSRVDAARWLRTGK